jgi:UDP-N-acetylmuramoyl-tripeptide--D-alanyl-D-alanine ligase
MFSGLCTRLIMHYRLSDITKAVKGRLCGNDTDIASVSIDTRTLQFGDLYVAIKGDNFDGHDFIDKAEQAGAAAVLVEQQANVKLPQIVVQDSRLALAEMAGAWRSQLRVKVAGITGSNGKTTVKEMIAAILAVKDAVLFTQGNLNNDIGVPLTLLRLNQTHRYAVIEMGANHGGEIAYTSRYAKPDVAVINNVGAAHIEGFGDLNGVARAKGEIIESLGDDGIVVLNRDDDFYDYWLELAGQRRVVSFGIHLSSDVRAENINMEIRDQEFVTRFELHTVKELMPMQIKLAGEHNVKNALAAAAVCMQFEVDLQQIKQGLGQMKPVSGRLQPLVGRQGNIIIDDSYNANPASLKAALEVLNQCDGEPWLVLGAFGELGKDSQKLHKEMGELINAMNIVRLLAIGSDARHTVYAFGKGASFFNSQDELINSLKQELKGHETVLIKGSRAQKMEYVAAALVDTNRA